MIIHSSIYRLGGLAVVPPVPSPLLQAHEPYLVPRYGLNFSAAHCTTVPLNTFLSTKALPSHIISTTLKGLFHFSLNFRLSVRLDRLNLDPYQRAYFHLLIFHISINHRTISTRHAMVGLFQYSMFLTESFLRRIYIRQVLLD